MGVSSNKNIKASIKNSKESSDKKIKDQCVCMMNIPENTNIDYITGKITFICEKHGKQSINIKDYFVEKDRNYYKNQNKIPNKEIMKNNEEEIKQFIKTIKDKRESLQYIIKFFDILIKIYEKEPKNSDNNINISNIAKNINNNVLIKESDVYSDNEDFESILKNIDKIKQKIILDKFNKKFSVDITGNEKEINLEGKSLDDKDLKALCTICFKNLEVLNLKNNNINNIEPVKNLRSSNLQKIDLSENQIEDFKALQDLQTKKLECLNLESNNISSIEPINKIKIKNRGLKDINLRNNKIVNLGRGILRISLVNMLLDNNKVIMKDIDYINNKVLKSKQKILKIIEEIEIRDFNLFIVYQINQKDSSIKLFGENFVKKNKDNCKIIIEGKEMNLESNYKFKEKGKILKVKLITNKSINDLSYIFQGCSNLIALGEDSINTEEATDMSYAFDGCTSLEDLDGISNFKTEKVENMSFMFRGCTSLKSLDPLENWKTNNVIYMNSMFENCSNLISLDGLSNWDTKNVIDMNSMFKKCSLLNSVMGIYGFNTDKVKNMNNIFDECYNLRQDEVENWKTKK